MANGDGTRNLIIGLVVALVVIALLPLLTGGMMMGGMMSGVMGGWGGNWGGWGGWGMGLGALFMLAFWGLVIAGIVLVVRWVAQSGGGTPPSTTRGESALDILQKRYARGEINKEEYEQKKRDLTS